MTLQELLEDIRSLGLPNPELLLASRRVNGKPIENTKEVHLREIARIEIDVEDPEIKLLAKAQAKEEEIEYSSFTSKSLQSFLETNPATSSFEVFGIDRRGQLDDGSIINLNLPLLGICQGGPNEIWLLMPPQEQWPSSWFEPA